MWQFVAVLSQQTLLIDHLGCTDEISPKVFKASASPTP
jgi:hypothetical protein